MSNKLKAIVVDDDEYIIVALKEMCKESPLIEIIKTYNNPTEFLAELPRLKFDLCMLDISMPQMEGVVVAQVLKNKPIIFISGSDDRFRDALNLSPVDIVPKPILKDRLFKAIEKAHNLLITKKEYEIFNVAESNRKVKLRLQDILLVTTDDVDPRHKIAWMRGGGKYTLMNIKLEHLVQNSPTLVQVNRAAAVSLEAVHEVEYDLITLKDIVNESGQQMQVTLGSAFKSKFKERMYFS